MAGHVEGRDRVGALETKLAEDLHGAGYHVMNKVNCRKPLDDALYARVRSAFAAEFPRLTQG